MGNFNDRYIVPKYRYRLPAFTHDYAEKAWGKSYWLISGIILLEWIKTVSSRPIDLHAWYDHRKFLNPDGTRCVAYTLKPSKGEIPDAITDTYKIEVDEEEFPEHLDTQEKRDQYILENSWCHLFFKWDTMSLEPHIFNLLLSKISCVASLNKIALVVVDTVDLYVNYNPNEWMKRFKKPYPVKDLEGQKEVYSNSLTYSGFQRLNEYDKKLGLIETPWYYKIPTVEPEKYGEGIREFPEYKVHPIEVTGGTFYPQGIYE